MKALKEAKNYALTAWAFSIISILLAGVALFGTSDINVKSMHKSLTKEIFNPLRNIDSIINEIASDIDSIKIDLYEINLEIDSISLKDLKNLDGY